MADRADLLERLTYKGQVETVMERVCYTVDRPSNEDAFSAPVRRQHSTNHEHLVNWRQTKLLSLLLEHLLETGSITADQLDDWLLAVSQ